MALCPGIGLKVSQKEIIVNSRYLIQYSLILLGYVNNCITYLPILIFVVYKTTIFAPLYILLGKIKSLLNSIICQHKVNIMLHHINR